MSAPGALSTDEHSVPEEDMDITGTTPRSPVTTRSERVLKAAVEAAGCRPVTVRLDVMDRDVIAKYMAFKHDDDVGAGWWLMCFVNV